MCTLSPSLESGGVDPDNDTVVSLNRGTPI